MLKPEKNYEFKKRLLKIHKENLRDYSLTDRDNELALPDTVSIIIPEDSSEVILNAARDLADYLLISMNITASISRSANENMFSVVLKINKDLDEYSGYMGYRISLDNSIAIEGFDDRGIAQAVYRLEDIMSRRRAPFVERGVISNKPMFSPRMVHSGYSIDDYPDEYLRSVAHAGMDAILIFVKGMNLVDKFLDFNELIERAARFGIDVYAYCKMRCTCHPDDAKAYAEYDNMYGRLFREFPGFKGIIFVGESLGFPSKDEHVELPPSSGSNSFASGKPRPGWWPCEDYPQWLEMVSGIVRKYKKDADVVFWTYNWSWAPEEYRIKLIENLPTDISLLVTYELPETYKVGDVTEGCCDYTISFAGPSKVFKSEAEAAKKRGIKLYSMTNTGGLTWDIGVIPYVPAPYQWIERYKTMVMAHDDWGLCGLMESHHYGFWPSIVSETAKLCFAEPRNDMDEICYQVIERYYGRGEADKISEALRLWSEAFTHYNAVNEHQYVAFRIGPSYPFCLDREFKPPQMAHAIFGNNIFFGKYGDVFWYDRGTASLPAVRMQTEINELETMLSHMVQGVEILEKTDNKNDELLYLINLGKFICCCVQTGINSKHWFMLTTAMKIEQDNEKAKDLIAKIEELAEKEIKNAESAIPLVEADSRLGWEASMEYMTDKQRIEWKIRHLKFVLESELSAYKKASMV